MKWARGLKADGTQIIGVVEGAMLHPRASLGEATDAGEPVALTDVTLLAPVQPGKFIGLWNNFKAAAEKGGMDHPEHPLYFIKADTSVTGPNSDVVIPTSAGRVVFEGELGIVIGKTCKNLSVEDAQGAIFGYTCVNDFTSLDVLNGDPSFEVFVNDRERQSYPASDMILSPEKIVSCLSQDMTLNPGDVIACGTSIGARPVKPGMVVKVAIDGIGEAAVTMSAPTD